MFNLNVFYRLFGHKLELDNIHKYSNQLICIFGLYTNGRCCSFNLIPNWMFYDD